MAPKRNLKTYSKVDKLKNTRQLRKRKKSQNVNNTILTESTEKRNTKLTISPIISIDILPSSTDTSENSSIIAPWAETIFDKLRRGTIRNLQPPKIYNKTNLPSDSESSMSRSIIDSPKIIIYSPKLKPLKRVYKNRKKILKTIQQSPKNEKSTLPEDNVLLHDLIIEAEKSLQSKKISDCVSYINNSQMDKHYNKTTEVSILSTPLNSPNMSFMASTPMISNLKHNFKNLSIYKNISDIKSTIHNENKLQLIPKVLLTPIDNILSKHNNYVKRCSSLQNISDDRRSLRVVLTPLKLPLNYSNTSNLIQLLPDRKENIDIKRDSNSNQLIVNKMDLISSVKILDDTNSITSIFDHSKSRLSTQTKEQLNSNKFISSEEIVDSDINSINSVSGRSKSTLSTQTKELNSNKSVSLEDILDKDINSINSVSGRSKSTLSTQTKKLNSNKSVSLEEILDNDINSINSVSGRSKSRLSTQARELNSNKSISAQDILDSDINSINSVSDRSKSGLSFQTKKLNSKKFTSSPKTDYSNIKMPYVRLYRIDHKNLKFSNENLPQPLDKSNNLNDTLSLVNKLLETSRLSNLKVAKIDQSKELHGFTNSLEISSPNLLSDRLEYLTPTFDSSINSVTETPEFQPIQNTRYRNSKISTSTPNIFKAVSTSSPVVVLDRVNLESLRKKLFSKNLNNTTIDSIIDTSFTQSKNSFKLRIKFKHKKRLFERRRHSKNLSRLSSKINSRRHTFSDLKSFSTPDIVPHENQTLDPKFLNDVSNQKQTVKESLNNESDKNNSNEFISIKKSLINTRRGGGSFENKFRKNINFNEIDTIDLTSDIDSSSEIDQNEISGCEFLENSGHDYIKSYASHSISNTSSVICLDDQSFETPNRIPDLRKSVLRRNFTKDVIDTPIRQDSQVLSSRSLLSDEIFLKPGKQWQRSLSILRRHSYAPQIETKTVKKGRKWRTTVFQIMDHNKSACLDTFTSKSPEKNEVKTVNSDITENFSAKRISVRIVPAIPQTSRRSRQEDSFYVRDDVRRSDLEIYACASQNLHREGYVSNVEQNKIEGLDGIFNNLSLGINKSPSSVLEPLIRPSLTCDFPSITARDIVLKRCNQSEPLDFEHYYPDSLLQKCHKIGEGVYGEVFLLKSAEGRATVLKIIPIEGTMPINGEHQKKFDEIISEIIIAQELSGLRDNSSNQTICFTCVHAIHCVRGKYPDRLIDLWELFDEDKGSENDHPGIFDNDQLYIVLELDHGGRDLESYQFMCAEQSYAVFIQTAFALAVAEQALKFEHRDLHWGNLLIQPTDEKQIDFVLNGEIISVPTYGVKATVIDFTLSRITFEDVCIYNNLADDPDLFKSQEDYQFEIYRLMQRKNKNEWEHFEPYTNLLWLHYTILKMIDGARYKRTKTIKHTRNINLMKDISNTILTYASTDELVRLCYKENSLKL